MKKMRGKVAALLLAGLMAVSVLTGCSADVSEYSSMVVATYGDKQIYLDEANLMARYTQWLDELYYMNYFGDSMWSQEYNGRTMEDSVKEEIMAQILQTEVLISHADEYGVSLTDADMEKVNQACNDFFETMDEKMIEMSGATDELVKQVYEKNALANKVWQAVVADVDTEVSLEESQQVEIRYILIQNDDEDYEDPEAAVNEIVSRIQNGEDIEAIADEMGLYCGTNHYSKYEETDDVIGSAAIEMEVGEARAIQNESVGWYAVYLSTDYDEEATAQEADSIITQRRADLFSEVYGSWEKETFTVDEDVWDEIKFDGNPVYEMPETTTAAETTAAEETTAAAEETTTAAAGTTAAEETTTAAAETSAAETEAAAETSGEAEETTAAQ